MNIFIMGAPGSGKGTFSSMIKEEFNLNHVSTGDIFRSNMQNNTPLGLAAKSYIEQGHLVPDDITNKMVADYLQNLPEGKNGYLLDGYPRTEEQAKAFDELTKGTDNEVELVLDLEVPFEVLTKRITGRRSCPKCHEIFNIYYKAPKTEGICDVCGTELTQRADDNEESLKVRLDEYQNNTAPVIEHYAPSGRVVTVNADRPIGEIWADVKEILSR